MKLILLIFFLAIPLFSLELIMENIVEKKFSPDGLLHIVKADTKTYDIEKVKFLDFFNIRKIAKKTYYLNGALLLKSLKISFKHAYFYEGNFYMNDCYMNLPDGYIKSEKAVYKMKTIYFKNLFMKDKQKKYKKLHYSLKTLDIE